MGEVHNRNRESVMDQVVIFKPDDFDRFLDRLKGVAAETMKDFVVEKPMTVKEAAEYLRVSERTMWRRINSGDLPAELIHRSGGSVYFFPSELHNYLRNR